MVLHGVCKDASQADFSYTLALAPILSAVSWISQTGHGVHPPAQLCCSKVALEPGLLSAPIPGWSTR